LSRLPYFISDSVRFRAFDVGSVIDLSALTTFKPTTLGSTLECHNGATLKIGSLTTLDDVAVTIGANESAAPIAQITTLTNGSIAPSYRRTPSVLVVLPTGAVLVYLRRLP